MIYAYSFMKDDATRPDGVIVDPAAPEVYPDDRPLKLCRHGFHASTDILDALRYTPGFLLRRVRCSGETIESSDKFVCRRRTEVWRFDVKRVLIEWACCCTTRALDWEETAGKKVDLRSRAAIEVVERYARGAATEEEVRAARAAARAAGRAAPYVTRAAAYAAHAATRAASAAAAARATHAVTHVINVANRAATATAYAVCASTHAPPHAARKKERDLQRAELLHRIAQARRAERKASR